MANEQEQYDKDSSQGEEEYQFSDDQMNYDAEPQLGKNAEAVASTPKENIFVRLKSRRVVAGGIVFVLLVGVVYKMVMPTNSQVNTEFTAPSVASSPSQVASSAPQPAPVAVAPVEPSSPQSVAPQAVAVPEPVAAAPTPPAVVMPVPATAEPSTSAPVSMSSAAPPVSSMVAKLAFLEQQNAAIINLLQTRYVQKTDIEAQNNVIQDKVQEINARVSSMEVAVQQMTKMLHDMGKLSPSTKSVKTKSSSFVPAKPMQPKTGYVVQAIIPGRAWLKSDAGDTVTVTEGDTLKGYGRVVKIDPYDGIVEIDTGSKMFTLSYGTNGDG